MADGACQSSEAKHHCVIWAGSVQHCQAFSSAEWTIVSTVIEIVSGIKNHLSVFSLNRIGGFLGVLSYLVELSFFTIALAGSGLAADILFAAVFKMGLDLVVAQDAFLGDRLFEFAQCLFEAFRAVDSNFDHSCFSFQIPGWP